MKTGRILVLAIALFLGASPAFARTCSHTTYVDRNSGSISSRPVRICSVEVFASGTASQWIQVYDSPGAASHAQAKVVAEPGVATAYNSQQNEYGDGLETRFGLGVVVSDNATGVVTWSN